MVGHKAVLAFFVSFLTFSFWTVEFVWPHETLTREQIIAKFCSRSPQEWGEVVKGVKTRLNTSQRVLALTFDACGGPGGSGYDATLIDFLTREAIPATLFIAGKWIDVNPGPLQALSKTSLFEIENHGLNHKPCSSIGRPAHGRKGTKTVGDVVDEIELNDFKILGLTGRKSKYYRPGTAYCDEVCVEIANALGYEVVNFSVRGDAGATYSKKQVAEALLHSAPGSIVLMHMNHPERETAEGVMEAVPELRKLGFRFVKLSEFPLK